MDAFGRMESFMIRTYEPNRGSMENNFHNKPEADAFFEENKEIVRLYTHVVFTESGKRIPIAVYHGEVQDWFWKC